MSNEKDLLDLDIHSHYTNTNHIDPLLFPTFCKQIPIQGSATTSEISIAVKSCKYMTTTMMEQKMLIAIEQALNGQNNSPLWAKLKIDALQEESKILEKRLIETAKYRSEMFEVLRVNLHKHLPESSKNDILSNVQTLIHAIVSSEEVGAFLLKRTSELSTLLYCVKHSHET